MSKPIAVNGTTLLVTSTAGTITAFSVQITSSPSSDISINDKGIYSKEIAFSIASGMTITSPVAGTTGTGTTASPVTGTISGTGSNAEEVNKGVMVLLDDNVDITATFNFPITPTPPSPPYVTPVTLPINVKVIDTAQTDVTLD